jgi:nitroreductase
VHVDREGFVTSAPEPGFVPLEFERRSEADMRARARALYAELNRRRSVRAFSREPVPPEVLEDCLRIAGTAPSGAHLQPWHFVVVTDPELKRKIREAAEEEERANYGGRMPEDWLEALEPLGTDAVKEHITDAPALIVVFAVRTPPPETGRRRNYYVTESVGIATGMLIAALHQCGLATLTHTPNPMTFLRDLLGRPKAETPFVLLPVGYPADGCQVPDLRRKELAEVSTWLGPREG